VGAYRGEKQVLTTLMENKAGEEGGEKMKKRGRHWF